MGSSSVARHPPGIHLPVLNGTLISPHPPTSQYPSLRVHPRGPSSPRGQLRPPPQQRVASKSSRTCSEPADRPSSHASSEFTGPSVLRHYMENPLVRQMGPRTFLLELSK